MIVRTTDPFRGTFEERRAATRTAAWLLEALGKEGAEAIMARQLEILAYLRDCYGQRALFPEVSSLPMDRYVMDGE